MSPLEKLKSDVAALGDSASSPTKNLAQDYEQLSQDAATVLKVKQATDREERQRNR